MGNAGIVTIYLLLCHQRYIIYGRPSHPCSDVTKLMGAVFHRLMALKSDIIFSSRLHSVSLYISETGLHVGQSIEYSKVLRYSSILW